MKYLNQFLVITLITILGETLNRLIPLPIPAAVYGLVLLFLALQLRIVKLDQVQTCGNWLIGIMGILFVAPAVNLIDSWSQIAPYLIPIVVIVMGSTVVVFAVAGIVTQLLTGKEKDHA